MNEDLKFKRNHSFLFAIFWKIEYNVSQAIF